MKTKMFNKILTLTAAGAMLLGLPLMAHAGGIALTGTTMPVPPAIRTGTPRAFSGTVVPGMIAHGQTGPITAPIQANDLTKGNAIVASVPGIGGHKVKISASGSASDPAVFVNLFTWHF